MESNSIVSFLLSSEAIPIFLLLSYGLYEYSSFGVDKWDKGILKVGAMAVLCGFFSFRHTPLDSLINDIAIVVLTLPLLYLIYFGAPGLVTKSYDGWLSNFKRFGLVTIIVICTYILATNYT